MATKRKHDEICAANDDGEELEPPLKKIHAVDVKGMNPTEKNWTESDVCFNYLDDEDDLGRFNFSQKFFAEKKMLMQSSEVFHDMFMTPLQHTIDKDTGCVLIDIKYNQDVPWKSWKVFLIMLHHHTMPNFNSESTDGKNIAGDARKLMGVIVLCTRYMAWSMHALLRMRMEQVAHTWHKYPFNDRVSHPSKKGATINHAEDFEIVERLCTMMELMSKWENYLIMGDQPGLWASSTAMKMLTFTFHALNRRQKFFAGWNGTDEFGNFLSYMKFAHQTTCGLLTRLNLSADNTYI
jgi:hypothetical protein